MRIEANRHIVQKQPMAHSHKKTSGEKSELIRFGIAMESDLLSHFDAHIEQKGYANRSEAIRDLIRASLLDGAICDETSIVAGTLTLVYDHHVRELSERLTEMQHELGPQVISTLHVHLDHEHCLEVIVMRGAAKALKSAANQLIATKGVIHGKLTLTGVPHHEHEHRTVRSP